MATNESVITAGQQQVIDQADALQIDMENYLSLLQGIADLSIDTVGPSLGYSQSLAAIAAYTTAVTADFGSGLVYPVFEDLIAAAKTDGYDSAFLLYLETTLKTKPTAAWVTSVRSIQATYTALTTASAQALVAAVIPALGNGNSFAVSMTEQVDDRASTEATNSALIWEVFAQDLLLSYQQEAINSGLGIEALRAKIVNDMITVHNDYNQAVVQLAKTDFQALQTTVGQIQSQIRTQLEAHTTDANETFARVRLTNRNYLIELDKDLATIKDGIRRAATDYELQLGRGVAFVDYANSALSQAVISGTMHGNYTSGSED